MRLKGQQQRQKTALDRRTKKYGKDMKQMDLPGMGDVFGKQPPPRAGSWPEVHDDRTSLDQAKGKYVHISQHSEVTPYWLQQTGHTYQTIPSKLMKGLKVDSNPRAEWGSGVYKVGDDGQLELVDSDWDTSG